MMFFWVATLCDPLERFLVFNLSHVAMQVEKTDPDPDAAKQKAGFPFHCNQYMFALHA